MTTDTQSTRMVGDMVDRVRAALGIADPGNNQWRKIYPCAWIIAFLKLNHLVSHKLNYSMEWIDIADALQMTQG